MNWCPEGTSSNAVNIEMVKKEPIRREFHAQGCHSCRLKGECDGGDGGGVRVMVLGLGLSY